MKKSINKHNLPTPQPPKNGVHPKTLIEMWIICLDPVSANSEKGALSGLYKGGAEIAVEIRA